MKVIDNKAVFDKLLLDNKAEALRKLKDYNGNYLNEVKIGGYLYKIFEVFPIELFNEYNSNILVSEDGNDLCRAIIIGDARKVNGNIIRGDFKGWYFIGKVAIADVVFMPNNEKLKYKHSVSFQGAIFCEGIDLSGSVFYKRVSFVNTTFNGPAHFYSVSFCLDLIRNSTTYFNNAQFNYDVSFREIAFNIANFCKAKFKANLTFLETTFHERSSFCDAIFENELLFDKTVFNHTCDLMVYKFGTFVDFRGAEFRNKVSLAGEKLCLEDNLSFPEKVITIGRKELDKNYIWRLLWSIIRLSFNCLITSIVPLIIPASIFIYLILSLDYLSSFFLASIGSILMFSLLKYFFRRMYEGLFLDITYNGIVKGDNTETEIIKSRKNLHSVKQIFNDLASYEEEDHFYYWYKVYTTALKKRDRISEKLSILFDFWADLITGYLTKPLRVFSTIIVTILLFGFLYCIPPATTEYFGINHDIYEPNKTTAALNVSNTETLWKGLEFTILKDDFPQNIQKFMDHLGKSFYFSAITFSTIGYGDYQPVGRVTMLLAACEGVFGVLLLSAFLVTIAKKLLW
ncbi:potassium channel family protein [Thermodesulfobacteriota bacterium]